MTGTRSRLTDPGRRSESGVSLIEMLVAMLIFSILSASVLTATMTFMDAGNAGNHRFANLGDAQTVMDVLTRDIRAAFPETGSSAITAANAESITVTSALGKTTGPTTITFTLASNGTLTQTSVQPNASGGGSTTSTLVLSTHITYPGSGATPLFSYYNSSDTLVAAPITGTTALSAIESVSINLVDNDDPNIPASAATLTAQIWLRNVVYN